MSDLIRVAEAQNLKTLAEARGKERKGGKGKQPEQPEQDEAAGAEAPAKVKAEPKEIPPFRSGDTVVVHVRVREGGKERIQLFKGDVIQTRGSGIRSTVTVRKLSNGVGVERIFPLHSPTVAKLEVVRQGKVRRAKLFYLRGRSGKAARIRERRRK